LSERPIPPVILAKAKIQIDCESQSSCPESILDSSLRWNDEWAPSSRRPQLVGRQTGGDVA